MLMRDVRGGTTMRFTEQLWGKMLRSQGGAQVQEALDFFAVATWQAANEVLREYSGLTWELLFVAICESRQACNSFKDGGQTFSAIVEIVRAHPTKFHRIITSLTSHIVTRGAKQRSCFSTRLFSSLAAHLRLGN